MEAEEVVVLVVEQSLREAARVLFGELFFVHRRRRRSHRREAEPVSVERVEVVRRSSLMAAQIGLRVCQ